MEPAISAGSLLLFARSKLASGQVVLANVGGKDVVKRLYQIGSKYHLSGSHPDSSSYSVDRSAIKGSLIYPKIF